MKFQNVIKLTYFCFVFRLFLAKNHSKKIGSNTFRLNSTGAFEWCINCYIWLKINFGQFLPIRDPYQKTVVHCDSNKLLFITKRFFIIIFDEISCLLFWPIGIIKKSRKNFLKRWKLRLSLKDGIPLRKTKIPLTENGKLKDGNFPMKDGKW